MAVTVPSPMRSGLTAIAEASPEAAAALVELLSKLQPGILSDEVVSSLYDGTVSGFSRRDFGSAVQSILGFHSGQLISNVPREEFLNELMKSEFVCSLGTEQQALLRSRLESLTTIKAIHVSAKALNVYFETPDHFTGVRTLTDIRPLFDETGSEKVEYAVITHTLKLSYHDVDRKELYLTVDSGDLELIQKTLERALRKQRNAEEMLAESGIAVLKIPKE